VVVRSGRYVWTVRSGRCVWIVGCRRSIAVTLPYCRRRIWIILPSGVLPSGIRPICRTRGWSVVDTVHIIRTVSPGRTSGGDLVVVVVVVVSNFVDIIFVVSIIIPVPLVTLK